MGVKGILYLIWTNHTNYMVTYTLSFVIPILITNKYKKQKIITKNYA